MKIERIELHHIELPLVHPFETSFGREVDRPCILVAVYARWACPAGASARPAPGRGTPSETIETAWHVLRDFLIPAGAGPGDCLARTTRWPASGRCAATRWPGPRWRTACGICWPRRRACRWPICWAARQDRVKVGVSVGIEPTLDELLDRVAQHVDEGYGRVKLKIKPGWDVEVVRAVRERWPDLPLQVDANCAYTLADAPVLRELDQFDLLLIEQPLHHDDIVDHAKLQAQIRTPICLDESIHSPEHARWALDIERLPDHQHQSGARGRVDRCPADPRSVRRAGRAGVVWRYAGDERRAGRQRGPGHAAQFHAARRHLRLRALLPARTLPSLISC